MPPTMPADPADLDAAWFAAALRLPVRTATPSDAAGIAVTSLVSRWTLTLDDATTRDVVVKLPRPGWASSDGEEAYALELRTYRELDLAPHVPRCLYQAEADDGRFVLVLEAVPGQHPDDRGMTDPEVDAALDAIADLHARYLHGAGLDAFPVMTFDADRLARTRERFARDRRHDRVARLLDPDTDAQLDRLDARLSDTFATLRDATTSLVHADLHTHNLLVDPTPDGVRVVFLDWQDTARGPALLDVAHLAGVNAARDGAPRDRDRVTRYATRLGLDPAAALREYAAALDFMAVWNVCFTAFYAVRDGEQVALDAEWRRYLAALRAVEALYP